MNSNSFDQEQDRLSVWRDDDCIIIEKLNHPKCVSQFIRALFSIHENGYKNISVVFQDVKGVFPNSAVPIAAIIQHYRNLDINIDLYDQPTILTKVNFNDPLPATANILTNEIDPLSKIWKFQDDVMEHQLASALIRAIRERIQCNPGVLEAFKWCLDEVMGNVFDHSQAPEGFAMVQVHPERKRLAVCIADTGIGIYGSLSQSVHKPKSPVDAITMAVKEGITRDKTTNQGNGLWGLLEIIKDNSGSLSITSGSGSLLIRNNESKSFSKIPFIDKNHQGTIIDFQIDVSQDIDIKAALGGYQPVNLFLENLENDTGEHCILIKDHTSGSGTRIAGEKIRTSVINIINMGASRIVLDFSEMGLISSSFADEFIGKLVVLYGFYGFQSIIRIKNMNEVSQAILHRSVAQRMMNSIEKNN